ncbi:unnamed protein product [Acanthoscelides obtectus]|nr:unnamed protein product [Acanthoscelides obtectus]CAK1655343.1 Protein gone early [Acanthoscelides obtectus]
MSSARNEATKFGNDIFSYEKRIAEITPDRVMLQNPITTYNIISISELRETNLIKFYDILLAMYKDSQITDQTEVIVTSIEYLHQIAQIISTTDRKTMNGYLIWTLVREYVPFLSDKYTSVLQNFHSNLYGIEEPMQRWEYCAKLTNRFMGLAVNYFREKKDPLTKETMQIVNTTFDSVVVVARRKIKTDKITNGLYEHLNTKLLNLRLQIGVPKAYSDLMFLKDYYLKFKIINHNFFENVKSAMEFQKKIEERRLSKSPPEETILSHVLAETPKVVYSASDHAVVVPRMLVKEPIFETHFPRAIIFGRLGHEISEAVISSILPYGSVWTAEKKILSPFHRIVDDSFKSVELTRNCLSKFIMETGNDISDIFANETALTTSIHLSALDVAEKALGLSLEKSIHLHQPALENFEDTALFFLAYAQTQCSESTRQQQFYDIITEFKLDHKSRLKLAWTQIPEFSQSLGCDFNKHFQCQKLF